MRVLGVDPGLRTAGYGCIDLIGNSISPTLVEAGAITLCVDSSIPFRLKQLHDDLSQVILDLAPDVLAVEKIFTHKEHVSTATVMGHARGVILLAGEQANLPLIELAPSEIKKSVTGNGNATKEQVQHAIASILKLTEPPTPSDVSDALAIAITGGIRET
ncbi:MAG: crossover junction endodeoxyribonuclease RuvC [Planctomycetes bacterium]|nr:crossover junction endodeoxyribonuclease RuvC [Planctomycetota bacterium]